MMKKIVFCVKVEAKKINIIHHQGFTKAKKIDQGSFLVQKM